MPEIPAPIPKPGKKIKGRVTKEWLATRRLWLKKYPPDYRGKYYCAHCGNPVDARYAELDHIKKRSTHPQLRNDLTNLQILCRPCHTKKDM